MLRIGDFSKLSRVSIRMLRHYDKIGLLVPESVDDSTGYRYYSESQLPEADTIQALRAMGFGLSVIGEILTKYEDEKAMEQFLMIKREELLCQALETEERIRLLDNTIQWLRKDGNFMDYNVVLKTMPERYVASVRQVIPAYDCEGMLWEILNKEIAGQNVKPAAPAYGLAVFHDKGFKESDVDVEIQVSVNGTYEDTENVKFKNVDAMQIASATYNGSYDQITRVNKAVAEWICENGYDFDGESFCIYHVSPHDAESPEDLVTEVCYPVKKKM
ncbi:MerR family transcriptional regulator [Anaerostipes sp.]|uniref:MerR family transcriptional regulator n=1 Tax=Anaerostipes sp. TaxID=1872530 RepID=UPI0025C126F1|nr:MerR family transcriptional regulator [Anaerostipes sp.]MBS7007787.1 MerR family transcriptional regulator [Anaerostipes sp.]